MYNFNSYGIDPYMYDDPYTMLARAQDGFEVPLPLPEQYKGYDMTTLQGMGMPIPADYDKSYDAYKQAYQMWLNQNSASPTPIAQPTNAPFSANKWSRDLYMTQPTAVNVQTPSSSMISPRALADYSGGSVWDFMTTQGLPGDLQTRKVLAKAVGIQGYRGSAKQNQMLMNMVRQNPNILDALPTLIQNMPGKRSTKQVTPQEQEEEVVDESTTTSAAATSTATPRAGLPVPTYGQPPVKTGAKKSEEQTSDLTKALVAMGSIALAGGFTYQSIQEAKNILKNYSKSVQQMAPRAFEAALPLVQEAASGWTRGARDIYKELDLLMRQDDFLNQIAGNIRPLSNLSAKDKAAWAKMTPEEKVTAALSEYEGGLRKTNPVSQQKVAKVAYRTGLTNKAPVAPAPKPTLVRGTALPKPAPVAAPSTPGVMSRVARRADDYLKELDLTSKLKSAGTSALKGLTTFAKGARNVGRFFRFQEGGENNQMNQIVMFIASELQQKGENPEVIAQKLVAMTEGQIDQNQALQLVNQVSQSLIAEAQGQLTREQRTAPIDEQQYLAGDEGGEEMMPQEYAYGGGYSGTYDQGSGSYFQAGGTFIPTYGDILPQYMYGSPTMQMGGSLNIGDMVDVSPEEMEYLRQQGYDFDIV